VGAVVEEAVVVDDIQPQNQKGLSELAVDYWTE
jgi:hypothetical protein